MLISYGSDYEPSLRIQKLAYTDEGFELIVSIRNGYGQVFMHDQSGDILIMLPESWETTYAPNEIVKHRIRYFVQGEHPANYDRAYGAPFIEGFTYIGVYAHPTDEGA